MLWYKREREMRVIIASFVVCWEHALYVDNNIYVMIKV